MSRLSLRMRLTLAFAALLAIVLAALGLAIHAAFRADTRRQIDGGLRARERELSALVSESGARRDVADALERVSNEQEDFAQVLMPDGHVLSATPQVSRMPLLSSAELAAAARDGLTVRREPVRTLGGAARVMAMPVRGRLGTVIVLVGTTLGARDRELATLTVLLAAGGTAVLLIASLASYAVAASALRPVETMRRRAAAILPGALDQRLPVPPSSDELARLGRTLNEMLARVDAAFARERVFVADASHQLRTPLAILKAEIELALHHGRSPQELRDALASAAEETDRLAALASDLLTLSQLDEGVKAPLREEAVHELVQAVARREEAAAAERGIALRASAPRQLRVRCERARLEQALGNAVENALRFARSEVRISARCSGERVQLHVCDDGPGFEAELLDSAFDRFARGSGENFGSGTGIGLAIVAAVAQAHGGSAGAANRPEGGADVWIELPAERAAILAAASAGV